MSTTGGEASQGDVLVEPTPALAALLGGVPYLVYEVTWARSLAKLSR